MGRSEHSELFGGRKNIAIAKCCGNKKEWHWFQKAKNVYIFSFPALFIFYKFHYKFKSGVKSGVECKCSLVQQK